MKKIITAGLLYSLLFSSPVLADWAEDFLATAASSGTEVAVVEALKVGIAPADITAMIKEAGGIEPVTVVKAFYCAGLSGSTVLAATGQAGLPETVVAAGYRQSVRQCSPAAALNPDPFSTTQNIASKESPVGERVGPPATPPGGGTPPPVILPPVDGGGGTRPPSVSPDHPN